MAAVHFVQEGDRFCGGPNELRRGGDVGGVVAVEGIQGAFLGRPLVVVTFLEGNRRGPELAARGNELVFIIPKVPDGR